MAPTTYMSLHCLQCKEALTLVVSPTADGELRAAHWLCPRCDQPHAAPVAGAIREVRVDLPDKLPQAVETP
jgi:hypothetical protein